MTAVGFASASYIQLGGTTTVAVAAVLTGTITPVVALTGTITPTVTLTGTITCD